MLPTTQEYKISLMIGQDSFRTLEGVEVIPNPNYPNEPWYSTGGLAIVFKLKLKEKLYALKCFYTEANERQERLGLIAAYLKQNPSPYFVDFIYLENELWVETDNNEGQGYPVVLMEWVEGKTLDNYLEQICTQNNTPALKNLYFQFCNLAWWLQQQPIAHGDIKHDNLIVTPDGKLKLIDYDGVFVPALRGRKANEMGSPCYQHPKRDAYFFGKNLDDFSLLVLQITLLALQHQPKFFAEHYNGDGIILKDTDYQNFAQSSIKTILWQLPEVKIPLLLSQLQGNLNNLNTIDLMPLLQDLGWINWLVGGQKDDKLEFERQRLKELVVGDERWRELFIVQVSSNYLLTETMILEYSNHWNCTQLRWRTDLPISSALLTMFWFKLDWKSIEHFIERNSINWSIEFLDIFVSDLKWGQWGLSSSSKIEWSEELIEKFKNKWEWGGYTNGIDPRYTTGGSILGLSSNEAIPWSIELIEKYEDKWSWNHLSSNEALPWSNNIIEKFKDRWDWDVSLGGNLSSNRAIPWSIELIEKYEDKWSWNHLSSNKALPWSIILAEKFKDKWDWDEVSSECNISFLFDDMNNYSDKINWDSLSKNQNAFWTQQIIDKFEYKWNWEHLSANKSFPWSIKLIKRYENKWNWGKLSRNKSLPWSIELIKMYEEKWNMESLWINLTEQDNYDWSLEVFQILAKKNSESENRKKEDGWKNLSKVNNFPWSVELIVRYKYDWDFFELSCNKSIPFSLIELTINHGIHGIYYWNWEQLSHGQKRPWSILIIEKYANYWYWRGLSSNPYLPWSIELINKFKEKWDYDWLSLNAGIPWSEELIRTYKDTLNWKHLSRNEGLPWTLELIERYKDKWAWSELSGIKAIPWNMKLFLKYENNWDCGRLKYSKTFYENIFIPILNDEFIDDVMTEIGGVI